MTTEIDAATRDRFARDPIPFIRAFLRAEPDPPQTEIIRSVAANRMTTVRSGHGIGKSATEAWLIVWYLLSHPFAKVPCTAPTQHQLHDILWAEIAKWINNSPAVKDLLVWTRERVYMRQYPETWFAAARTATKPDALQGFHADNLFFVIDEASGVEDRIFEPVLGALTGPGARLLMCGNPTRLTGFFHDSHKANRAQYAVHHVDGRDSPRASAEFVQSIIDMYGEDSDVFRVRVAGEFPRAQADSFIPLEWCERAAAHIPAPTNAARVDIGVDVARFGDDASVLCPVLDKAYQLPPEIYRHNDTMSLTGRVIAMIRALYARYNPSHLAVKVDCGGLGAGVYDRLNEQKETILEGLNPSGGGLDVVEVQFGGEGGRLDQGDPVEYANASALMWGAVREVLRAQTLTLQPDAEQTAQLSNRRYAVNSAGKIELERKEAMKKRGLHSPDMADALALALWDPYEPTRSFMEW